MLISSEPELQQKEKVSSKVFDTEDVKSIPSGFLLKYEIGRETNASRRDMNLTAIAKHYGI